MDCIKLEYCCNCKEIACTEYIPKTNYDSMQKFWLKYTNINKKPLAKQKIYNTFSHNCECFFVILFAHLESYQEESYQEESYQPEPYQQKFYASFHYQPIIAIATVIVVILAYFTCDTWFSGVTVRNKVTNLKKEFPSQAQDSWIKILTVLEVNSITTTKSLLMLHGEDKSTCNCLKKKLVSIYQEEIKKTAEPVTFEINSDNIDYGVIMQHYRPLIKERGVFEVDLSRVSPSIARMFHPLCDETYPDGKPALLLFTLRDLGDMKGNKPLSRAEAILKNAWKELSENEMNPLISRVVTNVISVISEENLTCTTL